MVNFFTPRNGQELKCQMKILLRSFILSVGFHPLLYKLDPLLHIAALTIEVYVLKIALAR